tara:strand:+ start:116 stop:436 length:321 start_codon:yes stop_codon:yes gene_type:complete
MKDEFIRVDMHYCFRKDEIVGFRAFGGETGDYNNEDTQQKDCVGDAYIYFYLKSGKEVKVNFGGDEDCFCVRDAYFMYLETIFNCKKESLALNKYLYDIRKERSEV